MKDKPEILIVDDREENLVALEVLLQDCDAQIHRAMSGNEALALMLKQDFALVLLDVQMPHMDGFEVAELMRLNEKTRYLPIIFITAISAEQKNIFKGYEVGAVDFLSKPINPQILLSKVKVFLELYLQNKELELAKEKLLNEIAVRKQAEEEKDKLISQLKAALSEVKTLRGIVPICSKCHKIRDDEGFWQQVDDYIGSHTEATMSHGLCLDCSDILYGGQSWYEKGKKPKKE